MRKCTNYFFTCILVSTACFSQAQNSRTIDSLQSLLSTTTVDTTQINILNSLSTQYADIGDNKKVLECRFLANKIAYKTENAKLISSSLRNIGNSYSDQSIYEKAVEYYLEALKVAEKEKDSINMAYSLNNLGNVYIDLAKLSNSNTNNQKALKYHLRNLEILKKINNDIDIADSWLNISNIYRGMGEQKKAIEYSLLALRGYTKHQNINGIDLAKINLGAAYLALAKTDNSEKFYKESEKYFFDILHNKDSYYKSDALIEMGELCFRQNRLTEALEYLKKGMQLSTKKNALDEMKEGASLLAETYNRMGDYKEAFEYQKIYTNLKDTLLNEKSFKQITEINTKYETEKKERELQIRQLLINQKSTQVYILIAIAILILIIAILLIWQLRTKADSKTIELQQKLLRSQMNPHFIFNALLSIQNYMFENNPHNAAVYLSKFAGMMRLILENSREEYIPLQNEIKTLEHYLELQQLRYENRFNYTIQMDETIDSDFIAIPPMLAQPFIENAIEHGMAGKKNNGEINIRFRQEGKNIIFEIQDNGVGISYSTQKKQETKSNHKSLAIVITKERLGLLNKNRRNKIKYEIIDLSILKNVETTGTKVIFSIPFKHL